MGCRTSITTITVAVLHHTCLDRLVDALKVLYSPCSEQVQQSDNFLPCWLRETNIRTMDCQAEQEMEIEALQAILMDDLQGTCGFETQRYPASSRLFASRAQSLRGYSKEWDIMLQICPICILRLPNSFFTLSRFGTAEYDACRVGGRTPRWVAVKVI